MCTASWLAGETGYRLLFNRDERKDRPKAYPPMTYELEGVKVIAPKDPKAGGTWIAVNEFGLSFAVFNNYGAVEASPKLANPDSRGRIPLALAVSRDLPETVRRFARMDFSNTPPFVALIIDRGGETCGYSWDGKRLVDTRFEMGVFTTSSFMTKEVEAYRIERFHGLTTGSEKGGDRLWRFQTDLSHSEAAFNPLMEREESMTHSLTVIEVSDGVARCGYYERIPGEQRLGTKVETRLPLNAGVSGR